MTKYTKYRLRLGGEPQLVAVLRQYIPETAPNLRAARDLRRALEVIFGEAVQLEIVALRQAQANVRRL